MNKQEALDRLDYISGLEYNWDSYNGGIIPYKVINKTKELLESIEYKYVYFIAPFNTGIEIELNNGKAFPRIIITVDIFHDKSSILICPTKENTSWEFSPTLDFNLIKELINKIFI